VAATGAPKNPVLPMIAATTSIAALCVGSARTRAASTYAMAPTIASEA
jgi:hypothetical protein